MVVSGFILFKKREAYSPMKNPAKNDTPGCHNPPRILPIACGQRNDISYLNSFK
jgi:hypothetical protein